MLVLPGWRGSGPDHWQSRWEAGHSRIRRVEQEDWEQPEREAWVARLREEIEAERRPVVLVAHSLGCLAAVHLAARGAPEGIRGALLAAPPDVERADMPGEVRSFAPVPAVPLPFPAIVLASRNDPWCSFERATAFGEAWGAQVRDMGEAGHINPEAGFGPWPEGLYLLAQLMKGRSG
jgi:predicted alpha/beta hydrolase family esterase